MEGICWEVGEVKAVKSPLSSLPPFVSKTGDFKKLGKLSQSKSDSHLKIVFFCLTENPLKMMIVISS